ncbi:MAG: hypothetical protein IJ438_11115 [Clostridia bacterium]|nr:hypothetical protein [Clostridia bacterium]
MKKWLCALLTILLLGCTAMAEGIREDDLIGTWRFSGGAEVVSYGFILSENHTWRYLYTDDYDAFPPARLIPTAEGGTWLLRDSTLYLSMDGKTSTYPLTLAPEHSETGSDTIHLAEGDGGGFYERCGEGLVLDLSAPIPTDILYHIEAFYADYKLEDYIEVPDTPEGDYAFALFKAEGYRHLSGFRKSGGTWENVLDTTSGVPQINLPAHLEQPAAGSVSNRLWDNEGKYDIHHDGLEFYILTTNEECSVDSIIFHWENGGFRMTGYQKDTVYSVDLLDGHLIFYGISGGYEASIQAWIETDIAKVNFDALPTRSYDVTADASEIPGISETEAECALTAEVVEFPANKRYNVYNGPGKSYQRAGNGKAVVSTNGWIQVFGQYGDWLLIQYSIDDERFRIGWITADALPDGADVPTLEFVEDDTCTLSQSWVLTDDPLGSKTALCTLDMSVPVTRLAELGETWAYVRAEAEGKTWWGFVPSELLGHG